MVTCRSAKIFFTLTLFIICSFSVKSVAQEQKTEIMSQLQTIRSLMKKRGMECPPLNSGEVDGAERCNKSCIVPAVT